MCAPFIEGTTRFDRAILFWNPLCVSLEEETNVMFSVSFVSVLRRSFKPLLCGSVLAGNTVPEPPFTIHMEAEEGNCKCLLRRKPSSGRRGRSPSYKESDRPLIPRSDTTSALCVNPSIHRLVLASHQRIAASLRLHKYN